MSSMHPISSQTVDAKISELGITDTQSQDLIRRVVNIFASQVGKNIMSNVLHYCSPELERMTEDERSKCRRALFELFAPSNPE